MMMNSLNRFIDPANYHPDAVANAGLAAVADVEPYWLIIRLGIALHGGDRQAAEAVLRRLDADNRQGHELFQVVTAKLILALESADSASILSALDVWLDARKSAPGNWRNEVLDAPELAPYIAGVNPEKLVPPAIKRVRITKADRAMVRDLDAACIQAVTENLEWLRPLGVTGSVKAIAKSYRIVYANRVLREVTLCSSKDWPDLIVALDAQGAVLGSFIEH
jgi:hypothetical protein